jgi:hypothetical protein
MGVGDWLLKRLGQREVTAGGSQILRYGHDTASQSPIGFPDEDTTTHAAARETVYQRFFGDCDLVHHEVIPLIPHVDVYVFPPGYADRDFYTLVTGGMSDIPMTVPPQAGHTRQRAELVLYCHEPDERYLSLLRHLAHFPHDNRTWFGHGHTMANGQPSQSLFPDSDLDSFLFLSSVLKPDSTLAEELVINSDPVNLLWVVPITTPESDLKLERGINALLDLFGERQHPFILDEQRRSYV